MPAAMPTPAPAAVPAWPPTGRQPPLAAGRCCCGSRCLVPAPAAAPGGDAPPPLPAVERLSARVTRVLGRNPSPFTLTGTNLYLVGTGAKRILVDAGEGKPGVLQDLLGVMSKEACTGLDQIVITHWHHDHLMGVPELLRHFGPVPVRKFLPPEGTATGERGQGYDFNPDDLLQGVDVTGLADGEVLRCEGAALEVLFTPGHANDHVSLLLREEQGLFTGDNVLGWGTGTFQDLQLYLRSLRRMRDAKPRLLYPAHGPVVPHGRAGAWMDMYISHREERIAQVSWELRAAASAGGLTLEALVHKVYGDQPKVLATPALLYGARKNSQLVLDYLLKEGHCTQDGDRYSLHPARL